MQHLRVAFGRDQTHPRTGAGEHRVSGNRRTVQHLRDGVGVNPCLRTDPLDAVQYPQRGIGRRGRYLGGMEFTRGFVDQQHVSKRTTHINA